MLPLFSVWTKEHTENDSMSSYSLSSKHNFAEVYKGCTNAKILKDIKDIKKKVSWQI